MILTDDDDDGWSMMAARTHSHAIRDRKEESIHLFGPSVVVVVVTVVWRHGLCGVCGKESAVVGFSSAGRWSTVRDAQVAVRPGDSQRLRRSNDFS